MNKPTKQRTTKSEEEKKLMLENGIDDKTFRQRVYRNMDRKEAATRPKRKYGYKKDWLIMLYVYDGMNKVIYSMIIFIKIKLY